MIRFFHRYQKWIFWGAVIPTLATFGVTGVMLSVCQQRPRGPVGEIYGERVSAETWDSLERRMRAFYRVLGQEFEQRQLWQHLAKLRKVEEAGIEVSDEEVGEQVRAIYRNIEAHRAVQRRLQTDEELRKQFESLPGWYRDFQYSQLVREQMESIPFSEDQYQEFLRQREVPVGAFEQAAREMIAVGKLERAVASAAKFDPEKVYERYEAERHRRKAAYAALRADDFIPSEATVTKEEVREFYDEHQDLFAEPRKVDVEWVSVPAAAFDARAAKELAEAPLGATGTAEPASPTATAERALDLAKKAAQSLRDAAHAKLAAGEAVTLPALIAGTPWAAGRTGLIEDLDLQARPEIQFFTLLTTVANLDPGGPASLSHVVAHKDRRSALFLRLLERREPRTPPFEQVEARVREAYLRGIDKELRDWYETHPEKFRTPKQVEMEYVFVPYSGIERAVPADVTGTARQGELRKRATARVEEVREGLGTKTAEGAPRDLETVALERGVAHGRATWERGATLTAEVRSFETTARLETDQDRPAELSPAFENEEGTGLFAYMVRSVKAEGPIPFPEAKERARRDLLAERSMRRAFAAAEALVKDAQARPAEFREIAAKRGGAVAETPFLSRDGEVPGLPGEGAPLVSALFGRVGEVGAAGPAVRDDEGRIAYAFRYVAYEPPDPAGYAAAEKDLRDTLRREAEDAFRQDGRNEFLDEWRLRVMLEAQSVDEGILEEAYGLRHGPDGLASVEIAHIYVPADEETIRERLGAKAKADAGATLQEIRAGARFRDLARKRSQDPQTAKRGGGGDLGRLARGKGPFGPEFEAVAFSLKSPGEVGGPVKTEHGWHLIELSERHGDEIRARHILFRGERGRDEKGDPLPLDAETKKAAMDRALEKAKKAEARLQAGEDFAAVARDAAAAPFREKQPVSHETPFERAVLAQRPGELSEVITITRGSRPMGPGTSLRPGDVAEVEQHHLLLVHEESEQRARGLSKPRTARHIVMHGQGGRERLEQVRQDLLERLRGLEAEGMRAGLASSAAGWEFRQAFEDAARNRSEAKSGARGGSMGLFHADPEVARWGEGWRDRVFALAEGETSPIFEGKEGWHLVRVSKRVKKSFEEARREVAAALLVGMEF